MSIYTRMIDKLIDDNTKKLNYYNYFFLKNHSICRFQSFIGYSLNLFGGSHVSDFLSMSWSLFFDKKRKIFHKLCKNHFLSNIKYELGPKQILRHSSLYYDIKEKHTKFEKSSFNID